MVRGVSHRIVVFGLVCICSMLGLVHGQEITGEQLDKFLGSRDARIMYSWQIRTLLEAQSAHRPVAQAYAYIFLQAPDLAADLIEGGPGALAGRVTKDAIFAAAKTIVGHPEKACMEMANTLYDKGLEDYRANYKLYKEYKENGALSKEDRQAFIARGDPLEKVLLGKELFADTLAYKYNAGEWEGVRDRVLSKVAELEGVSSQWDALTTLKEVKEVLAEAKAGLDAYPPYQKHLERMHELTKESRETCRIKCTNNLKQIGIALQMYSDDYDEKFPLDLRFLYNRYFNDSELLVCPSTGTSKATAVVPTDNKVGKPANISAENMSYCYVAGLKTTDPVDYILVFDEDTNHRGEGVNVLYIGQHVSWRTDLNVLRAQLKKQEQALKAQGREIKIIRPSDETKRAQPCPLDAATSSTSPGGSKMNLKGRIVFRSDKDGDGKREIYIMNADGTGLKDLTPNTGFDPDKPVVSPNGQRVACVGFMKFSVYGDKDFSILIANTDGSGFFKLFKENLERKCEHICWSPDGKKIAYSHLVKRGMVNEIDSVEICISEVDGEKWWPTGLTPREALDSEPSWSPKGDKIAFCSDGDIYFCNPDGSGRVKLTNNQRSSQPTWAPDGRQIAYVVGSDICVMSLDNRVARFLTNDHYNDGSPKWSPDGKRIVFQTKFENSEIRVVNVDGTGLKRLTENKFMDASACWSPDGTKLVFVSDRDTNQGIYVMNPDGTDVAKISIDRAGDTDPIWIP